MQNSTQGIEDWKRKRREWVEKKNAFGGGLREREREGEREGERERESVRKTQRRKATT